MRNDTGLRKQMKVLFEPFITFYLTNGDVAWLMETTIGDRYFNGTYDLPPGWRVAEVGETDKWKSGAQGLWKKGV